MSEEWWLDAASLEDLPAMLAIERSSYTHPWSEASLREAVARPRRFHALVLRKGGAAAPEREVRAYCIFQVVADELHVHNLAVEGGSRRRGLARLLLRRALELGRAAGAGTALLEVRESNAAAQALYTSLGFDAVGHRRGYYQGPNEDALVLRKDLS